MKKALNRTEELAKSALASEIRDILVQEGEATERIESVRRYVENFITLRPTGDPGEEAGEVAKSTLAFQIRESTDVERSPEDKVIYIRELVERLIVKG